MAAIPTITRRLKILLPTTFPMAIPGEPPVEAIMFTASSGAEVPKDTTVKPIIRSDIFNFFAIDEAPLTR